jgi:putative ABC transport system permease protein
MTAMLRLALKSAWARRWTLGITLVAIAMASALLLAVERVRQDARHSFSQSISGVDLVVGARSGAVQLMLHAVFHAGSATNNIRWDSFQSLAQSPDIAWAVPLSMGDSTRGYPVVGTRSDFFTHFRYADGQTLHFTLGEPFAGVFDAVLGSDVALALGLSVGSPLTLTHGLVEQGPDHADKPFTVTGVLSPTGTPVDRSVYVSLEAISAIHLDWAAGAPVPGLSIPAQFVQKFDLQPREVTAALIGLKNRSDVFRVQRRINNFRGEPLLAVLPGVALDELWSSVALFERLLFAVSALVVIVGLSGLIATLLAGLNERRRELALLRALGASPQAIFALLAGEGVVVTVLGVLVGLIVLALGVSALAPVAQAQWGITLAQRLPSLNEGLLIALILISGLIASLIPGWRAWRMSLADGLTPRN